MFSPETPPSSRYRHKKPLPAAKEGFPWIRILQVLFIIGGIAAIAGMIFFGPKQKKLVCNQDLMRGLSLTSFGSCSEQPEK